MKTLLILTIVLAGCADPNGAIKQFSESFNAAAQARAQNAQSVQTYNQNNPVKRIDNVCFQNCTQSGYQYGLCQSRCSY